MYSSVFAKSLHNAYSYSGGWEILGEREILMQFYSGGWEILGEREILMQFYSGGWDILGEREIFFKMESRFPTLSF